MSELPEPETTDPREIDHGEMSRPSQRHLSPGPLPVQDRKALWAVLAAGAALALAVISLVK
jgi:hypothetical protein